MSVTTEFAVKEIINPLTAGAFLWIWQGQEATWSVGNWPNFFDGRSGDCSCTSS